MNKKLEAFLAKKGISKEAFEAYDAEQLAGFYNEYNDSLRQELAEELKAAAEKGEENSKQIAKLQDGLNQALMSQVDSLNSKLKDLGVQISAIKSEGAKRQDTKTLGGAIKEALTENKDKLKGLSDNADNRSDAKSSNFSFTIPNPVTKAVGDITSANISGGNVPVEDRIEGLNTLPSRQVRLLDIMAKRSTDSNLVSWVYQANKEGAAGQTAEGTAKNQIDFDLVVASESVKKTTAFIKVTTEMIEDISWLESEIRGELMRELLKVVEAQAYEGDGTGQNHTGIRTVATAFAAGAQANAVDNANNVDVLAVAMTQIMLAEQPMPDYILMSPADVLALKLIKVSATDNRYVDRLIQTGSTLNLDGVPIIQTTLVTPGEYLIGYFPYALLVNKGGVTIDVGLDGNDFTTNKRTIIAEWRGMTIVKNNDRTAFVAGVFATDKAALETA